MRKLDIQMETIEDTPLSQNIQDESGKWMKDLNTGQNSNTI